ncbi:DUF4224 domain-containing protein [Shewanella surugensis]|uniref:DUF4224 domain-containing protein n=1 Tax=Shewanella surugensis TaxID=212020 RepID=A0ABT0LAC5_9GAMM|nr:DUF4224 domain-containing protein [Shewanella surugensis]MCL1124116.1 DUF4224 domain-containing protein [Shewanella surugensis]
MSELLTAKDLEALSGYKLAGQQKKWLDDAGINHYERRDGKPVVTWYFVNNPYKKTALDKKLHEPNFAALG